MSLIEYIRDIYCDVLGPRKQDPEEVIETQNPKREFITGILSSSKHKYSLREFEKQISVESESSVSIASEEDIEAESDIDLLSSGFLNPVLNPQKLPVSMGLGFVLESQDEIEFDVCITWGKYYPYSENDQAKEENNLSRKKWKRESFYYIGHIRFNDESSKEIMIVPAQGEQDSKNKLRLKIEKRSEGEYRYFVSIYLINEAEVPSEYEDYVDPPADFLIFQPQIRIKLKKGKLANLDSFDSESEVEERIYEFPYLESNLLVPAKGIMCAAVWKDIDPLQMDPEKFEFMWADGKKLRQLDKELYLKFLNCDLRTEFVPIVPQGIPEFDIEGIDFDPEVLSELSPRKVKKYFSTFVEKYRSWIDKKKEEATQTSDPKLAKEIICFHEVALDRIEKGLDLLEKDEEILLCFNFANKVISTVQKEWNKRNFKWRPFQIAFFLMTLESIVNPQSQDRNFIDVLWVPTGGGKTEAYLAISVFLLAYRRRKKGDFSYGTTIISRYTLRLLTIQQFNRTLKTITACEYLRVFPNRYGKKGWLPNWFKKCEDFVWGKYRFSIGLWVGGSITPNKLHSTHYRTKGALDLLKQVNPDFEVTVVSRCPVCGAYLSIPKEGIFSEEDEFIRLNLIVRLNCDTDLEALKRNLNWGKVASELIDEENIQIEIEDIIPIEKDVFCLRISFLIEKDFSLKPQHIDRVWENIQSQIRNFFLCEIELLSLAPDKPGYFPWGFIKRKKRSGEIKKIEADFTILCPNPECALNQYKWEEFVPSNGDFVSIFSIEEFKEFLWMRKFVPIPAYFIDEQIYSKLPSIIISTVDKFARLPFEPATAAIFGNVDYYNPTYGFFRENCVYSGRSDVSTRSFKEKSVKVKKADPPELIIQDELHLIEGPLGSLTGLYETIIDSLCKENAEKKKLKYISSSATIKHVDFHTWAVFERKAFLFPPMGLTIEDNFFSKVRIPSLAEVLNKESTQGKIYMGIMAPGLGALTPQIRVYSRLWLTDEVVRSTKKKNSIVGYYNALRELAGGRRILEQDIKDRLLKDLGFNDENKLPSKLDILELSSRIESDRLSLLIEQLEKRKIEPHFVITTSVFGTGVDVPHLRFMVVAGQPKTTSTYIQATGRVGRKELGLVITLYRATRPRDISHYEFFAGYHMALYRYVEETAVFPFSKGCVIRGNGPVIVGILRNSRKMKNNWISNESARIMKSWSGDKKLQEDLEYVVNKLLNRNKNQEFVLKMESEELRNIIFDKYHGLGKWESLARKYQENLVFVEYFNIQKPVVLGDLDHEKVKGEEYVVYQRVPNSLRSVEDTIDIEISFY